MAHEPLEREVLLAQRLGDRVLAGLDGLLAALLGEPLLDLVAGAGALDELEPVARRPGAVGLGRQHLDDVAVLERRLERHEAAVDARADAVVPDLGVDGIREVDGRAAHGQRDDRALRGEDVDLAAAHLEAQRVEELARVLGLALPVEQLAQPGHVVLRGDLAGRAAPPPLLGVLVLPVRGDAVLGAAVHRVRADLDLDRLALRADDRRVQRLVHVELRHRDVVLEPARDRVPPRVQGAQRRVAVAHRVDEDPHGDEVVDLLEVAAAHDHLLVDGVVVLGAARHDGLDLGGREVLGDLGAHPGEVLLTGRRALGDETHDLVVDLRVERREREVLELPLDGVHAEAVRERGVDLEGLVGLALGRLGADVAPRAGVVQPVGELDDEDADVAGHRDDHLAHRLGLGGLAVGHLVELGDAVDEHRDLVAEVACAARRGRMPVSSTVSCSSAAARVGGVMPSSARIVVTASGCVM